MPEQDGAPAGGVAAFDISKAPEGAKLTVKINDRDVELNVKDLPKLAAMGYRFSENMEEANRVRKEGEQMKAQAREEAAREFEPQTRLMQYLEAHPEKRTAIRMIVNDEGKVVPLNGHDDDGAASGPSALDLAKVRDELLDSVNRAVKPVLDELTTLKTGVGALSQRNQDQEAVDFLRSSPSTKDLVNDASLADAREYRRKHGGDLIGAFKNVTYEDGQNAARSRVIEQYGIDTESQELPGSRPPVVGGITLDEKTNEALFGPNADPDDLAPHAAAIRAHRKKMGGKKTALRSRR